MTQTVDFSRPYEWKGGDSAGNADFILQDGMIYGWSESNMRYEQAWWLDSYLPVTGSLAQALRQERPLPDGDWKQSAPCGVALGSMEHPVGAPVAEDADISPDAVEIVELDDGEEDPMAITRSVARES